MAFTEQTRTQLIGLSVAMLGQAPGAKRLQEWINAYNDGMTLEDLAEHIADSEGFKSQYGLSTSEEFAADFLGAVMDGNASGAALGAAEAVVVGALNDGSSQADIALLLVTVLMGLAGDGDNDLYANYGKAAEAFHNKVEVAEHYTLKAKMADPSASVLEGVTDDPATVEAAKRDIDSPPADAVFAEPGAFAIDENASGAETPVAVGMVAATDANGDEVAYRLVNAPDGFAIDAATGAVTYTGGGLDYETTPAVELTVHASSTGANGQPTEVPLKVTVNVGDVQESDAVFADAKLAIDENVAEGMVGKVTATDAEGDAVAYRLAEGSPAGFSIDGATGEVSYKGDDLDHEAAATVDLTVIATSIGANNMATDVSKTFTVSIGDVDDLPDEPMRFVLTPTIDDFQGGDADDTFVAAPVQGADRNFAETLNAFDSIDGGGGADTILVSGEADLDISLAQVSNIEKANIRAPGSISADMSEWAGLESVEIGRFGSASAVTVIVNGASVEINERLTIGGAATIVGAKGAVDIKAGSGSVVHVGSAGHTETVMVKGGKSVKVDNGAGRQSQTVTTVSVDGVKLNAGMLKREDSGTFDPLTDTNGFLTNQNGSALISITTGSTDGTGGTVVNRVGLSDDGVTLTNAFSGAAIPVTYNWDHDGDKATTDDADATPPETGPLAVTAELKFDINSGGLAFGKITAITGYTANAAGFFVDDDDATNTIQPDALAKANVSVPVNVAFTSAPIGKEDADPMMVRKGAMPTLTVKSDSIAEVHLHNTQAIALVENQSKTGTGGAQPEDLAVTVDGYGTVRNGRAVATEEGKLCVDGTGSAKDIDITVAGASNFRLASDEVESLDINAGAALWLKVHKFDDETVSTSLKSITVEGGGGVTMNGLNGMSSLASIDASGSSGKNSFKSTGTGAELAKLKTAMGGSGSDTFALTTSLRGNLESVHTGDGNDVVMMGGDYRDEGLRVDLGAGDDTFHGSEGNSESRIDGGEGRDTLRLTEDGMTYKDGDKTKSIYENFEILDLGGGSGPYDVGRLGIDTIVVKESTGTGGVTLNNVGAGTTVRVEAKGAGTGTTADVKYNFASDVNTAGSLIDGGTTNILNVSLMAKGGSAGTRTTPGPGAAELKITLDEDLVAMTIDSDASVHRIAAAKGVTDAHYKNTVDVMGGGSALEEVKITGGAQTELKGGGLASLEYVNARESGAGVTVDAKHADGARVRLVGSNHDDKLTSGDFNNSDSTTLAIRARNTLQGNGGDDMLTGGTGRDILIGGAGADKLNGGGTSSDNVQDRFVYNAASESQVSFSRNEDTPSIYDAKGYDVISNFESGARGDSLHFSKALHAIVTAGNVRIGTEWGTVTSNTPNTYVSATGWNPADTDGDGRPDRATTSIDGDAVGAGNNAASDFGASNLHEFIGDGRGLFKTTIVGPTTDQGATTRTVMNSIAVINQTATNSEDETTQGAGQWLLFDINKDGDFDADEDMVIFLAGATTFDAANDITSA